MTDEQAKIEQPVEEQSVTPPEPKQDLEPGVEVTETQDQAVQSTQEPEHEQTNEPAWFKERFARRERQLDRKYQSMIRELAGTFQNTITNIVTNKASTERTESDSPIKPKDDVEAAVLRVLQKQQEQTAINQEIQKDQQLSNQVEKVRSKYSDYDDMVLEVEPYFTQQMLAAIRDLPTGAVEAFYSAWKTDPEDIKTISKMTPIRQVTEMGRIYHTYTSKNQTNSNVRSNAPKPLPSINGQGHSISNDPMNQDFIKMAEDMISKGKRK